MFNMFLGGKRVGLIAGVCIFACAVSGCLESSLRIASESRLPKWVTLPAGGERAGVLLIVTYYTTLWGGSVQLTLQDKNKQTIEKVRGKERCFKPFQLTNSPGGLPS